MSAHDDNNIIPNSLFDVNYVLTPSTMKTMIDKFTKTQPEFADYLFSFTSVEAKHFKHVLSKEKVALSHASEDAFKTLLLRAMLTGFLISEAKWKMTYYCLPGETSSDHELVYKPKREDFD